MPVPHPVPQQPLPPRSQPDMGIQAGMLPPPARRFPEAANYPNVSVPAPHELAQRVRFSFQILMSCQT